MLCTLLTGRLSYPLCLVLILYTVLQFLLDLIRLKIFCVRDLNYCVILIFFYSAKHRYLALLVQYLFCTRYMKEFEYTHITIPLLVPYHKPKIHVVALLICPTFLGLSCIHINVIESTRLLQVPVLWLHIKQVCLQGCSPYHTSTIGVELQKVLTSYILTFLKMRKKETIS